VLFSPAYTPRYNGAIEGGTGTAARNMNYTQGTTWGMIRPTRPIRAEWFLDYLNRDNLPDWITDRQKGEALLGESVYDRYVTRKEFFTNKDGT
jgi:hypothetical protein